MLTDQQLIMQFEKFIICSNCRRYCLWDERQCNCCGEPLPDEDSRDEENVREYMYGL